MRRLKEERNEHGRCGGIGGRVEGGTVGSVSEAGKDLADEKCWKCFSNGNLNTKKGKGEE